MRTIGKSISSLLFVLCTLFYTAVSFGQLEPNPVYDDSTIPIIRILIDADSLAAILDPENATSDHEYPATFIFSTESIQDTVDNVGFRLRGNTSRHSRKKSFKISINSFEPGRKYRGFEKLNINGEHNDPSIIRSKLSWDLFKEMDVPSSRANHVELYINDEYFGLYINVEHIDENFVRSRFGNNDGDLFKCLYPADLGYLGSDPDLYKETHGDRRAYELKINTEADDYTSLADFITNLNKTPDIVFAEVIEEIFNVNSFLRYLAVDVAVGSWDDYWFLMNNYYLYQNLDTGKFEFIPYDYDNTFGIDFVGGDWGNRPIYDWGHEIEPRPLVTRILAVPEFRDRFSYYLNKLLTGVFDPDGLFERIDAIHDMITASAERDTIRTLDYGYSVDDFHNSYTTALGGHVTYGLKPFVTTRLASALSQLQLHDVSPIISDLTYTPRLPQPSSDIWIAAHVEDEDPNPQVAVFYRLNSGEFSSQMMFDDGLHQDGAAGDLVYGAAIPATNENGTLEFYVSASDDLNKETVLPRGAPNRPFSLRVGFDTPGLFINEFVASNDSSSGIFDELGESDDWVEIYNGDSIAVWLGDKFLTDNLANPDKWQLPDTTLQPGGFLLIWADDDPEQGANHIDFKLDRDGEQIGIYAAMAGGFVAVDSLRYGFQETNVSVGRFPDGSGVWQSFTQPTPGRSNGSPTSVEQDDVTTPQAFALLQNYPNPFNSDTVIPFTLQQESNINITVYNILGAKVKELVAKVYPAGRYMVRWDGTNRANQQVVSGVYFIRMQSDNSNARSIRAIFLR